jgi:hypothetical protein
MYQEAAHHASQAQFGLFQLPLSDSLDKSLMSHPKYMIGSFYCLHDNNRILQRLSRDQAALYCLYNGCILVDTNLDFFLPFHSLVHKAMSVVYECYQARWTDTSDNSFCLDHRMSKKFNGSETFQEAKDMLVPKVSNIGDYLEYVVCIPHMTVLLHIHYCTPRLVVVGKSKLRNINHPMMSAQWSLVHLLQ